ncbi:MAG: DNA-binding protein [Bacteroidales bacterium 43_8]|nr:MAG: DNA-binding protein [Bacteroidales bacterium 43_8]
MEYETISKETPEMKQLISGIKNLTKRVRTTAQTHRPLLEGELYLTGREVCERLFLSPRTLQDYRDKGIFPYTQIAGKILYRLSDLQRILKENYVNRNLHQ